MLSWFQPSCPAEPEYKAWVDQRMMWLLDQFGTARLRGPVILPDSEFFPDRYDGTPEGAQPLFERVCRYMQVKPGRLTLGFFDGATMPSPPAGLYSREDGREVVFIDGRRLADAPHVVATMAHEVAHALLLGDGRVLGHEDDHEWLTDLATVFVGMGLITANAAVEFRQWITGASHSWTLSRQGYLAERGFGYALGLYAWGRGEDNPVWARHLTYNLRSYVRQTLRYLRRTGDTPFPRG